MSTATRIEWTDATWNPVRGCSIVSKGCTNCYAMKQAHRFSGPGRAYEGLTTLTKGGPVWTGKVRLVLSALDDPLRWTKPRRIFVNSMSDLFHEDVPDHFIDELFSVMAMSQQHTFQILTKRARRMRDYVGAGGRAGDVFHLARNGERSYWADKQRMPPLSWPLPNVWLGVSVEDQATADERIPLLLATPAAVRWISAEPLLGPLDLTAIDDAGREECFTSARARGRLNALSGWCYGEDLIEGRWQDWVDGHRSARGFSKREHAALDWIVTGGESGPGARPAHPDWFRTMRDQCALAGVPFFFKQWGNWLPSGQRAANGWECDLSRYEVGGDIRLIAEGSKAIYLKKHEAGRLLYGLTHDELPA